MRTTFTKLFGIVARFVYGCLVETSDHTLKLVLVSQDLVEDVKLVDEYEDKKRGRVSHCYRLMFRSMERNLLNEEIDVLQFALRDELAARGFDLR